MAKCFIKLLNPFRFQLFEKSYSLESLESLLLGQANLLSRDFQDNYTKSCKNPIIT